MHRKKTAYNKPQWEPKSFQTQFTILLIAIALAIASIPILLPDGKETSLETGFQGKAIESSLVKNTNWPAGDELNDPDRGELMVLALIGNVDGYADVTAVNMDTLEEFRGATPLAMSLPIGQKYNIAISKDGYKTITIDVSIDPQQTRKIKVILVED